MFYVSEIRTDAPETYGSELQRAAYAALDRLGIPYRRVETDEAISMDDCTAINEKLEMKMVKTLFLSARHQAEFFLFVTLGDKPFSARAFSAALGVPRASFAPAEAMEAMLGAKIGAATVFSALLDKENRVRVVIDKDVFAEPYFGCSDGTTTGYMKLETRRVMLDFLPHAGHIPAIIEV